MTLGDFPDDFELITAMQGAKHRAEDFQRNQDAVAGRETGHGNKHQRPGDSKRLEHQRRQTAGQASFDILMQDAAYVQLRDDAFNFIDRAETASENALIQANQDLNKAQDALNDVMEKATRMPDGKGGSVAVFKDENGQVWTENDELVSGDALESIEWQEGSPNREAFQARKEAHQTAQKRVDDITLYQVDVAEFKNKLNDKENPMSAEEIQQQMDELEAQADPAVKDALKPDQGGEPIMSESGAAAPKIEL